MEYGYILKISNKVIYQEIQFLSDRDFLKVGLDIDCDIRFHRELFFENFTLTFKKNKNQWNVSCSENTYIDSGDIRKLRTKTLVHGDQLVVRYQESNAELFKMEFLFDFDNEIKNYNRIISISEVASISIGSSVTSNLVLEGNYSKGDYIELINNEIELALNIKNAQYGVYHNGSKAADCDIIKNGDFFSIANYSFYYKDRCLFTDKKVRVNGLNYKDNIISENYPLFNRNTRVKSVVDDTKIEILDPPAKPEKQKANLFTRLLPSMGMIIVCVLMAVMSSRTSSVGYGWTMLAFSGVSGLMAIVTAVIGVIQGKKDFKEKSAKRISTYKNYIKNKKAEIEKERIDELKILDEIYISQGKEKNNFTCFSSDLFDRVRNDEDYLSVRLGTGKIEAHKEIDYKKQEKLEIEDELQTLPEQIYKQYKYLEGAPIVCDFKECNAIGIVGKEVYRLEIMKNIIFDICARQFQTDVKLFIVSEEKNKDKIKWLRMLPHLYNEQIGISNIICNDDSKNLLFEFLYKEMTIREDTQEFAYNIIVFLYNEYGFHNHPISRFVENAKELGITFVFFGEVPADIGQGCDYLVDIKDQMNAKLISTKDKMKSYEFIYESIPYRQAKAIVDILAPVYTKEISLEGTLTKNISLFKLLNIIAVDDIDLGSQWKHSQVYKSMAAPIGVSKSGVIYLDLHDKAHGPHGLVAGTTGSGKSEILQTYILSMATLFHPYEVGFVIIDFKGGGMVNQFKELPHLVGAITNIDGKEIDRSLKSIKAELKKRQRLFAEADVNHIDKYIKKFKAREVEIPLPHLILIVDEFAELRADQPEFMKELISAARIGRSLGVHLILATQKPSGQVDDQIWSNSRFKLCLKVQDQADSNEVIKSPLASEIKEPGRAYFQVGNNEIFELFQSAYSGAPEMSDGDKIREFTIFQLTDSGRKIPIYQQKKERAGKGNKTQLDAIVNYIYEYSKQNNIRKLSDICLPPLPEKIGYIQNSTQDFCIPVGIYDDPDNQIQEVFAINIFGENTLIVGSSLSGKTNLLQLIIRGIANNYSPDEVNIYIIDFASMVLKNFEALNHVGGIVCSNEDEKLKNLFRLLTEEIGKRKEHILSAGVSNYFSYKEAGNEDIPQIVLLIDNLTALNELYLQDNDTLLNICREGLTVGISVVVANSQIAGIGYKYLSNFSSKVALFCNDSSEYNSIFDYCRMTIPAIPGRCIIEREKQHFECQTYLSFEGEKEFERVEEMRRFIEFSNSNYLTKKAAMIPVIPDLLTFEYVIGHYNYCMSGAFEVVAGLNYDTVSPVVFDLSKLGMMAITGRTGVGKSNFMRYLITLMEQKDKENLSAYIIDNVERKLESLQSSKIVKAYSIMPDVAIELIVSVEKVLNNRYEKLMNGNDEALNRAPLILIILNNADAIEAISNNIEALNAFKNIIGRYKNMNICVIVGDYANVNVSYSAPEVVKIIREHKKFLYFDDIDAMKILDLPLAVMRKYKKPVSTGDCYYINDNECVKIKSVKA